MGFFKDFKNDMKQAVNELIPENDEMTNEYDDDDMVNTLDKDSKNEIYVDTNEEDALKSTPTKTEEEILEDVDLSEFDDIEIDAEDLQEELPERRFFRRNVKKMKNSKKTKSAGKSNRDMDSLADLLAGNTTIEDVAAQGLQEKQNSDNETMPLDETTETDLVDMGTLQEEKGINEEQEVEPMTEDKIIEMDSINTSEASDLAESDNTLLSMETEAGSATTYIARGTRIEGNLFSEDTLNIGGTVEGDINCTGKLIVGGLVNGKVEAGELYANAAKMNGEIVSSGSVKIGVGSVIVGNVDAQSAVIAGAVNGDIDVKGPVIVDSTAVIVGNIKSRSVQINNGAVIEGFCSQCYSDIDVKSFFV